MCDNYKKITNCCTLILRGNDLFDFEAFVFIRSIIFGRIYLYCKIPIHTKQLSQLDSTASVNKRIFFYCFRNTAIVTFCSSDDCDFHIFAK